MIPYQDITLVGEVASGQVEEWLEIESEENKKVVVEIVIWHSLARDTHKVD